jgi:hypothetical protein
MQYKHGIKEPVRKETYKLNLLSKEDITENIIVIKINRSYRENMSAEELYDVTRGFWKRKIESVEPAEYALAVAHQVVKEVYKIHSWVKAEDEPIHRKTIPYNEKKDKGRIIFEGKVADEKIREKYIGKSVADFFQKGEASPTKVIMCQEQALS